MKAINFLSYVLVVVFAFSGAGCLSIPNSPVPKFYTLRSAASFGESKKFAITSKPIIGIGPVEVPEYQNRPQIVTRDKFGMLTFAQFERWGEPLDSGLERLILENLVLMLPQADFQIFPCNFSIPLDYQVIVNVVQLESQMDKDILLTVQWTIVDAKTKKMLLTKRSQIRQGINPHTYSGLTQALSRACTLLSSELAENLAMLSNQSETKDILSQ
jgi:uncharacterized lipoprotein YmbA